MTKSSSRKIVQRTHLLLDSKMVKIFLGRSNSNSGLNQLTSMVDMPCRIIGKFQLLKQVHSTHYNFENCHFLRVKIRMLLVKNQSFEMHSTITNTMKG